MTGASHLAALLASQAFLSCRVDPLEGAGSKTLHQEGRGAIRTKLGSLFAQKLRLRVRRPSMLHPLAIFLRWREELVMATGGTGILLRTNSMHCLKTSPMLSPTLFLQMALLSHLKLMQMELWYWLEMLRNQILAEA